jgi:hypothetical protein
MMARTQHSSKQFIPLQYPSISRAAIRLTTYKATRAEEHHTDQAI